MSADTREQPMDRFARIRANFRVWRGQRPFWGGMLTLLAGIPIMYIPYQNLTLGSLTIRMSTTAGAGSLIIGVLLIVLGLTMWFQPQSRVFSGVAAILLALVSLVVSNVGAFLIGFLLGMIGGALGISWAPGTPSGSERSARHGRTSSGVAGDRGADSGDTHDEGTDRVGTAATEHGTAAADADGGQNDLSVTGTASSSPSGADANQANGRHGAG
ncbi:DUF6114 domain-containing protein [Streptomyces oceani]|uniref:Integral membrane protein n=1 Tax=Streptomyces oceani TaxID=1075402 RepID=A0A1E7KP36_9ACTN|nr:DUF6114 domain-containing protein [Streptomyces oceani]OEV05680.1 hypothetical protein AN216_01545 [Streptomyces oceani]